MNLNPFIDLVAQVIGLYNLALLIYIILQWLLHFDIVNGENKIVAKFNFVLYKITEPILGRIRKDMPNLGGIDLSPILLFLLLGFIRSALYSYFYVYK